MAYSKIQPKQNEVFSMDYSNNTTDEDNREDKRYQENSNSEKIIDHGSGHSYWTQIPNIVDDLDLDPYEFRLYMAYKRVAGEGGSCYMKTSTLLEKTKMGERKFQQCKKSLSNPRAALEGLSLITIIPRYHAIEKRRLPDDIIINNIWGVNFSKNIYTPHVVRGDIVESAGGTPHETHTLEEEQQSKKNHRRRTTTSPKIHKSKDGSKEPAPPPPLKKKIIKNEMKVNQDSLPLFHPHKKYLKGLSENEITQIQMFYEKNGRDTAENPIAWITACVRGNWYKEEMLTDQDLQENFKLARRIEYNFEKLGKNNSYTYVSSSPTAMFFMKGGKEIPMPSYNMQASSFQESITNILINKHKYSNNVMNQS